MSEYLLVTLCTGLVCVTRSKDSLKGMYYVAFVIFLVGKALPVIYFEGSLYM